MKRVDVAVVGAGPAGLAAAIRVRWIKTHRGVPCSVVVYDPAPPGGLVRVRSTKLTGPGFHLSNRKILPRLLDDIEALNIEIAPHAIDRIEFIDGRWRVYCGGVLLCEARAVILATGLRRLANEDQYFGRGLTLAYCGYDFVPEHLQKLTASPDVKHLLVVGNAKSVNVRPILKTLKRSNFKVSYLIDELPSKELEQAFDGPVHFGQAARYTGEKQLDAAECVDPEGNGFVLPTDLVFLDYTAFEIRPRDGIQIDGVAREGEGFFRIDREGRTNLPGLFAAGDATGLYAMALKALSEGSVTGFTAARYVYEQKFGHVPNLFAYAANDVALDPGLLDYPAFVEGDTVELIGNPEAAQQQIEGAGYSPTNGSLKYSDLENQLGDAQAKDLVVQLMDEKLCTLQPAEDGVRGHLPRA